MLGGSPVSWAGRYAVPAASVGLLGVLAFTTPPALAGTSPMSMSQEEIQEVILRVKSSVVLIPGPNGADH